MTCGIGENFQGPWGPPRMMALDGGSFGVRVGGEATDFVLLVMNDSGARGILEALLVVDDAGESAAIITRRDILRALEQDPLRTATVVESGSSHLVVAYPDETLGQARTAILHCALTKTSDS